MTAREDTFRVLTLLGCVSSLLVSSGCTLVANSIANRVLSNLESPDDLEQPPTAVAVLPSTDTASIIGGNSAGLSCSIPAIVSRLAFQGGGLDESEISLRFRQACVSHDYCYRHGSATYGYTQADC